MTPRLNIVLLVLLLALGIPFYWYFIDAGTDSSHPKPVTMAYLRDLALQDTGPLPVSIRHELVGIRHVPLDFLAAGAGLWSSRTAIRAFDIIEEDGSSVTIDSGLSPQTAKAFDIDDFNPVTQHRIDIAVRKAKLRLYLSNFPLHQRDADTNQLPPIRNHLPHAMAPGVVQIPTPGLTDGSAMYFVHLRNGQEFLFTGDAATLRESWQRIHPPARYVTSFRRPQNRRELSSWLMTINALHQEAPEMAIIEGHDLRPMPEIKAGFIDDSDLTLVSGHLRRIPVMAATRGISRTPNLGRKHAL